MAEKITLVPESTALLAMDFQSLIVDSYAADRDALLGRMRALLSAARDAGVKVIYVVVGFRAGYPEVSTKNALFSGIRQAGRFADGDSTAQIHSDLVPGPNDVVVTKHRVSAFAGTDLEMILRANDIDTLVLTGIATSGVVLSTVRHASDSDYRLLVVEDCCADHDEEVHRVLTGKVFPRQAAVVSAEAVLEALG